VAQREMTDTPTRASSFFVTEADGTRSKIVIRV
jgi:hypothetical protein